MAGRQRRPAVITGGDCREPPTACILLNELVGRGQQSAEDGGSVPWWRSREADCPAKSMSARAIPSDPASLPFGPPQGQRKPDESGCDSSDDQGGFGGHGNSPLKQEKHDRAGSRVL